MDKKEVSNLFSKKQLNECIYCGCDTTGQELHFVSSCCGRGMCNNCYDNLQGTDEQIQISNFDAEEQDIEIIEKCGWEHADYICFECFGNWAYYANK